MTATSLRAIAQEFLSVAADVRAGRLSAKEAGAMARAGEQSLRAFALRLKYGVDDPWE